MRMGSDRTQGPGSTGRLGLWPHPASPSVAFRDCGGAGDSKLSPQTSGGQGGAPLPTQSGGILPSENKEAFFRTGHVPSGNSGQNEESD